MDANISAKYPCGLGFRMSYTYIHEFMRDGQKKFTDTRPHTATVRVDWGENLDKVDFNYSLNGRILSEVKQTYTTIASTTLLPEALLLRTRDI